MLKLGRELKSPTPKPCNKPLGDLVWIYMRKERFQSKRKSKIKPRSNGPFEFLEKTGANAYKVGLPGEDRVYVTFKVADLRNIL